MRFVAACMGWFLFAGVAASDCPVVQRGLWFEPSSPNLHVTVLFRRQPVAHARAEVIPFTSSVTDRRSVVSVANDEGVVNLPHLSTGVYHIEAFVAGNVARGFGCESDAAERRNYVHY